MTECRSAHRKTRALSALAVAGCLAGAAWGQSQHVVVSGEGITQVQGNAEQMIRPAQRLSPQASLELQSPLPVYTRNIDPGMITGDVAQGVGVRGSCTGVNCPTPDSDDAIRSELDPNAPIRIADNFSTPFNGGAQVSISSLCWWGAYGDNTAPASETFTVNILADAGGYPGATVHSETFTTGAGLSRTLTGNTIAAGALNEFAYTATFSSSVSLDDNTCYWIEILQEGSNPVGWFWETNLTGANNDARYCVITDLSAPYSNFNQVLDANAEDLSWCVDLALGSPTTCSLAQADMVCTQADGSASCQSNDASGGGIISDDLPAAGEAGFITADDFEVPADAGTVSPSEICWGGFYANTGTQPDFDSFAIKFYENANGAPGALIAELYEGLDFTVTRGWSGNFTSDFLYSTTLAPGTVNLTGGNCYWISIVNSAADSLWVWDTSIEGNAVIAVDGTDANGVPQGWTAGDRVDAADMYFCLGFDITAFGGCPFNPSIPANDQCSSATATDFVLTADGPTKMGTNLGATATTPFDNVAPCDIVPIAPNPDVWYSVTNPTASDLDLTVSTNYAGTAIDTVLGVYCGDCFSGLNCVAGNDDDPNGGGSTASAVTFTAAPSTTYYIRVAGFGGDVGDFEIGATSAAPAGTSGPCEACSVPQPTSGTFESEACGSADTNGGCAAIDQVITTLPGRWFGTVFADAGTRDLDAFGLNITQPTDVLITVRNETPIVLFMLDNRQACANPNLQNQIFGVILPASCDGSTQITVSLAPGNYWFLLAPSGSAVNGDDSFEGAPCGTYNNYQIDFESVAQGQCCLPDGTCTEVSQAICDVNSGTYGGDGTDCATGPTCVATAGACCLTDGTCAVTVDETACTDQGGTFEGVGTDCTDPSICTATCPCETDGDPAQVNVFDLLAYLSDWFPQNGMSGAGLSADFNNSGNVDVFDLLDFLTCWFPANAGNPCP